MADKREIVVQGVKVEQVRLQNNWYTPVDGRVKIAQTADPATIRKQPGYHVVSAQIVPMGERYGYHCMVEYPVGSGIIMPGSDFIDMKDPSGLAKAETSAIGRALGLHGIASEDGIASAEEMQRVVDPPIVRREKIDPPLTKDEIKAGLAALGYHGAAWIEIATQTTGKTKEQLAKGFSADDLAKLAKRYQLLAAGAARLAQEAS